MCCRNQTDVDTVRPATSQTFELLLLQYPQQLRLQGQGNVADFVEEQCSSVSHFEPANFLSDGTGESALFVAEQFAFEQVKRNSSAIQLDEWAPAAWTDIVNGTGNQLLARTGLSKDQDSGIG